MKIYRGTNGDVSPVKIECEKFGYPLKTTCGETMYDNTHFKTENMAWQSIIASVHAQVSSIGITIKRIETELKNAQKFAGEAAKRYEIAHKKYNEWLNAQR